MRVLLISALFLTPFLAPLSEQNGIGGTLPSELKFLQSLKFFLLEEGILTGIIPPELGDIRTLEQIDLNFNLLAGPLPDSLYTLTNLQQLDLNDNELTGSISPLIGQLTSLTFFQVDKNQLTGTIPTQMGSLVALGKEIAFCPLEVRLYNEGQHVIPHHLVVGFYSSETEVATLDNNQMAGTMPAQVCANSASLEVLTADCLGAPNRPSPPLVVCSCCTECF